MQILRWVEEVLRPRSCSSEELIYNDMESQSGRCLPIIYQPFDIARRMHWTDRGALFDFLCASDGWGKRILDFGPGDGWPSLIMAPFVSEVVGIEGSLSLDELTVSQLEEGRPDGLRELDSMLRPLVGAVVDMAAPLCLNPMITAVK